MSWTVPQGCYYAYLDTNWYYKGAGVTVADSVSPAYATAFILVDFANGYIYTNISKSSYYASPIITMNADNSFVLTEEGPSGRTSGSFRLLAGEGSLIPVNITLDGEPFAWGDGTGMLSKSELVSSGTRTYSAYFAFYKRTDITTARFPQGVDDIMGMYNGCTGVTSSDPLPNVASVNSTFEGCSSLTTAPAIPASVVNVTYCFYRCSSLRGNLVVYNQQITRNEKIFTYTQNDIYIVNGAGASAVKTAWEGIANGYSNVHYEADDNPIPSLTFSVTRVGGMASETPVENGEYGFINATAIVYETYLPDGWSCAYDAGEEDITEDGTTASPYWTRTNDGNTWTLKCWFSFGDTTKHTFTLQVADEITDANDTVKASHLSAIVTQILPKAYKLVDYYHDPNTDTEGMSVGKFATDADLFDVDMPALFRDDASFVGAETLIDNPYFSLDTTAASGTDHDLYAAITALNWQSDVIV